MAVLVSCTGGWSLECTYCVGSDHYILDPRSKKKRPPSDHA